MLRLSLGTMTFGWDKSSSFLDDQASSELVSRFVTSGQVELDTALIYSEGESEKMIGRMIAANPELIKKAKIATKANAMATNSLKAVISGAAQPTGGFSPEKLSEQLAQSLVSLGVEKVALFYLHMPDHGTSLEVTLEAINNLHKQGLFDEWGLSNFAAWEVASACQLCKAKGWVQPTVYQGMYNAVTRSIEDELIPVCREFGLRFRVYNPLAGGMLTGKHNGALAQDAAPPAGRFKDNPMYQNRFWKPAFFDAMEFVKAACDAEHITMTDAAFRWLQHHSALSSVHQDGIILGVSNMAHLEANLQACAQSQPLPASVVEALNKAWEITKPQCPVYFRGHSNMNNKTAPPSAQ